MANGAVEEATTRHIVERGHVDEAGLQQSGSSLTPAATVAPPDRRGPKAKASSARKRKAENALCEFTESSSRMLEHLINKDSDQAVPAVSTDYERFGQRLGDAIADVGKYLDKANWARLKKKLRKVVFDVLSEFEEL